jgi:hypothetical protein
VEDPSKFHLGRFSTASALSGVRVRVLERVLPTASTHTYSAKIFSGKARASYLAITEGSRADCPVNFGRSTLREVEERGATLVGANAEVAEMAERESAMDNFIFDKCG